MRLAVRLEQLVVRPLEDALKELARVYVRDALKRWVPGATLVSLAVEQDGPALTLRVRVRERETNAAVDVSIER